MSNLLAADRTDKIVKSDAEWRAQLTPERYRVMRQHGTERAIASTVPPWRSNPATPDAAHTTPTPMPDVAPGSRELKSGLQVRLLEGSQMHGLNRPVTRQLPPVAERRPSFSVQHGLELVDEYAWLRAPTGRT